MFHIAISENPINISEALAILALPEAGAIDVFIGNVRNHNQARGVDALYFECYDAMAIHQMELLAKEATQKWPVLGAVMIHRKGMLTIGDTAVLIAVSTAHRADAFEACRWLIDSLKQRVPIWKREHYADGTTWLEAHP